MEKRFIPSTSFLLDRIRHGGVEWRDGKFFVLGMRGMIGASFSIVYLQRLLEKEIGHKRTMQLYYSHGKFQAKEGVRIFNKRFGFAKTFSDIEKALNIHIGQFQFTGTGKFEWLKKDLKKKQFVVRGVSPVAEEYSLYFSPLNEFIDHFHRGLMAGFIGETLGEEMYCIEEGCVAHGKPYCTFAVRKKQDFDQTSPTWKAQDIKEEIDLLSHLPSKREPLL
jgi:predicted hydrocarbon binding protein